MSSSFSSSRSGSGMVVPMEEVQKVFNKFDENGDGLISCDEIKNVLSELGCKMELEEVQTAMSDFDKDGDGHIDLEEFTKLMNRFASSDDICKYAFDVYDVDKNGLISASELHRVFNCLGQKFSVGDCATMITKFDANGDGFINFQEFKNMMKRS